jgi:hypothetical protein
MSLISWEENNNPAENYQFKVPEGAKLLVKSRRIGFIPSEVIEFELKELN